VEVYQELYERDSPRRRDDESLESEAWITTSFKFSNGSYLRPRETTLDCAFDVFTSSTSSGRNVGIAFFCRSLSDSSRSFEQGCSLKNSCGIMSR